jgi:predicted ATPase
MVGRERETTLVRQLLSEAEIGRGGMLVVSGDGGVGKSRLLREACEEAERNGWRCLVGRAFPVEAGIPYSLFADAAMQLFWKLDADELATVMRGSEAELGYIVPGIGGLQPADRGLDQPDLKARLLWNFAQVLTRLSERQPLLLILDDLQWADASSIELLHFIARRITGSPIAVIGAYNSELVDARPDVLAMEESLVSIGAARSCELRSLSISETAALVREHFGAPESATREFSALVFGWTRGNPFFLDEVLKALVDKGRIRQVEGVWTGWNLTEIDLPASVRDSVRGRLRSLSAPARALADTLAVAGMRVAYDILPSFCGCEEAVLLSNLEELRRARLVEERLDNEVVVFEFVHPMVREALYSELGLARARRLHGQVAEALEAF